MLFVHTAGGGGFNEAAIIGHRIVEPEAAGEVIAVKAVSSQDTTGNVAPQAALADDVHRFRLVQLIQALPKFIHRDIQETIDVSPVIFPNRSGVQQSYASITGKLICIFQMPLFQNTVCDI